MNNKGFTLIELMVVIAVIGILASIVLVAYPSAQNRAKDGVVMADMDQLRTAAEVAKGTSTAGDYSTIETNSDCVALKADIDSRVPGSLTYHYKVDGSDYSEYCAVVQLNSGNYWCVDSNYYSGTDHSCASGKFCNGDDM